MFYPSLSGKRLCDNVVLDLKREDLLSLFMCFFFFFVFYVNPWLPISQLKEVLVQLRPINTLVQRTKSEETEKEKKI